MQLKPRKWKTVLCCIILPLEYKILHIKIDYYEQDTKYLKDKNQDNKFCPRLSLPPPKIPRDNLLNLYHKFIFKPMTSVLVKRQIKHTLWKAFKKHSNILVRK